MEKAMGDPLKVSATPDGVVEWSQIDWTATYRAVERLQARIAKATRSHRDVGSVSGRPLKCLSRMRGNPHVRFLEGPGPVTASAYSTPARGDLLPTSRTDPLIGTTTLGYDAFNRQNSVTDPNGVTTETVYDALGRVRFTIQRGATPAEDLVTEHRYNVFGDLFQQILPRSNVIEYLYDAAGRLVSIERKPDAAPTSHGERTLYQLDAFGHQVREEFQRWDGVGWVTESRADYAYSTRCHLDQVTRGAGSTTASVTEYAYSCDGDLEQIWDANHPSLGQTQPATTIYSHDELDRVTNVTQPWGGAGGGNVLTAYSYDPQDHLTQVTDAEGGITTYQWSDRDLLTREESEVSGLTTYAFNEHGETVTKTDARGITINYTVDALDRVTFEDYPGDDLDVTRVYDDPLVPFSKGRLTSVERDGQAIGYGYDRFGRITRDGELEYILDRNSNRQEIRYPGGVIARYTHDFADREANLELEVPGEPLSQIVSTATYAPFGPLSMLVLGNGLSETLDHDSSYFPERIRLSGATPLLDWQYSVDGEGNPTAINDLLNPGQSRVYGYQDVQYYLTQGDGPWGNRSWSFDHIGNRLSETRDGITDTYSYSPNAAAGNSAKLAQVQLGAGGTRTYAFDAAGNQTQVTEGTEITDLTYEATNRLAAIERSAVGVRSEFAYDGRSYLRHAEELMPALIFTDGFESGGIGCWSAAVGGSGGGTCPEGPRVGPTYSSDGILHHQSKENGVERYVLYFADRPVLLVDTPPVGSSERLYVSTDHLGTPILASDPAGAVVWSGGFEPFGDDFSGAQQAGVYLRFPGQWTSESWASAASSSPVFYNVHRWYQPTLGRYNRTDPAPLPAAEEIGDRSLSLYDYGNARPSLYSDPSGRITLLGDLPRRCQRRWQNRILPRLRQLGNRDRCSDFFCTVLKSDLASLINGALPFLLTRANPGGGFVCNPIEGPRPLLGEQYTPDLIQVGQSSLCGSVRTALSVIIHELGHFADCVNNGNAIKPDDHSDGCGAEVACLSGTIGVNCPDSFPRLP